MLFAGLHPLAFTVDGCCVQGEWPTPRDWTRRDDLLGFVRMSLHSYFAFAICIIDVLHEHYAATFLVNASRDAYKVPPDES